MNSSIFFQLLSALHEKLLRTPAIKGYHPLEPEPYMYILPYHDKTECLTYIYIDYLEINANYYARLPLA